MIGDAPLSKYTGVPGWETEAEEETLIQLTREYVPDGGAAVEIGGEYGRSAAEFGYALKDKKDIHIYTVDLFPVDHHLAKQYGGLLNVWRSNIVETGLPNENMQIIPIPGDSGQTGKMWRNGEIDFLFIDGDHTYEGVKRDIAMWTPHVKAGGIIVFHDVWKNENSHPIHKEVLRAVDEWYDNRAEKLERIDLPDSLLAFRKFESAKKIKDEPQATVEPSGSTPEKPATKTRKSRKGK